MAEILRSGIPRATLYGMRDDGIVEQLSRGVYRLKIAPMLGYPDLVTVVARVPHGVICLISALAYHRLTTQIPHEVYLAVERGSEPPRIAYPPVRLFYFSGASFREGIEEHKLDRVRVRIYNPEKTIADCFKFRNKVGMDVVLEALRLWKERRAKKVETLLMHARQCRVEGVIRPYLEALL
jgi:predicted transcriptional regulator of viral defense system